MEKRYTQNIAYFEQGSGETLVFLHGYFCTSSVLEPLLTPLSQRFRIIIPDLPGHGASPEQEHLDHVDKFAEVLIPFLNQVCPGKFLLYGHSMGAYIALAVAEKIPPRISKLGLINASAKAPSRERIKLKEREKYFIRKGKLDLIIRSSIQNSFLPENIEINEEIINKMISEALRISPNVVEGAIEAIISRPNRLPFIKSSGFKVDYLIGANDPVNKMSSLLKETEEINNSCVKVFPQSGHFCFFDEQETFINYFLSKGQPR